MSQTQAILLLIGIALVMANLPWLSERFLFFITPRNGKRFWMRLIEWLLLYMIVGFIATGFEKKFVGEIHNQSWEFYVSTFCLFLVFALPGFVYRHQLKKMLERR